MNIDNKTLFFFVVAMIFIIYAFSKINIELNIIFGTLIAGAVIYFIYMYRSEEKQNEDKINTYKKTLIVPHSEIISQYDDIAQYLFSIQDFYIYNPNSYDEIVKELENFFRLYEETLVNSKYAGRNYEMMNQKKNHIKNALHSIIYRFPTDKEYTEKLETAIVVIDKLLKKYLDEIEDLQKKYLYEHGYNNETKVIDRTGIIPSNSYGDDKMFTYNLF